MTLKTNKEWAAFIDRTRGKYYAIILSIVKNPEEAEDILQEVYINIYLIGDPYKDLNKLGAKISFQKAIDRFRTKQVRRTHMMEKGLREELMDQTEVCGDIYEHKQYLEVIMSLLKGKQAECLKLYIHGYTYKEIADMQGLALGTVQSNIHFTRKMLIENLKNPAL